MAVLRRPVPRFFVWVTILVAVAVVTAVVGLAWWLIALIELAAWVVVSVVERAIWRGALRPAPAVEQTSALPADETTAVTTVPPARVVEPVKPQRRQIIRTSSARTSTVPVAHVRWNVWSLEKLARANPRAEELEYVVVALRDFADADGRLPADFDPLVRESFGDLLPG
jgi:hypothetical protein